MEGRFAGAENQGERRRRRLATDDPNAADSDVDQSMLAEFSSESVLEAGQVASAATLGMISRIVSRHLWKHIIVLTVIGLSMVSLVWQSYTKEAFAVGGNGDLFQSISGLFLLLSGQLCFLIGWLRQESVIDFRGRYRWWRWLAVATFCIAVLLVTNTLHLVPTALVMVVEPFAGEIVAARPALVVAPCLAFCLIVLSRIIPDMTRCPASQSLFVAGLLTVVIRQMLLYGATNNSISSATFDTMLLAASFLMFASTLLHSRFVAYICNDPPVSAINRTRKPAAQSSEQPVDDKPASTEPEAMLDVASESSEDVKPKEKTKPTRKSRRKSRNTKRNAA